MRVSTVNNNGFALVYGLVVLLLASVGGTALLFLAQKDHANASDYLQMRSASQAAMAAMKSFEGMMLNAPDSSTKLLKAYTASPANKYLFGSSLSSKEVKVKMWGDGLVNGVKSPQYSGKILGFDRTNYFITIEGKGYGSNGGVKKVIATYQLGGLGLTDRSIGSSFGLFLNGRLQNCNARIQIKGNVYLSMATDGGGSDQHFNAGGIIEGNLKTASSTNIIDIGSALSIKGNALFLARVWPGAPFKVSGNAAFTKDFYNFSTPNVISVDGNAYFTQSTTFGFANCIDGDNGGGKTVYYRYFTGVTSDRFKDFDYKANLTTYTEAYVASQLGMSADKEEPFGLNLPASWGTNVAKSASVSVSGANLDTWWAEKSAAGLLFQNEWLVLNQTGDISLSGGTFTKKVIWVTNGYALTVNKNWPNCALTSNTLLIANGSTKVDMMGVPNGSTFRGLIYLSKENASSSSYSFGGSSTIYGAIQHAGNATFNLNGGGTDSLKIWFNDPVGQSALQEIVNTGIILAPGATTPEVRYLELADTKIRPSLMNLQL